jgi:glycerophosphoryl diester phosphodiesterase
VTAIEIVGHRGAAGEAPENTLAGFAHARSIGVAGVEFDVRLSGDSQLVVIHDATVDRTTYSSGTVAELDAAEMAAMDARRTCPSWPEPTGIPTLSEALDIISSFEAVQFEIKSDAAERLERVAEGLVTEIRARSLERQASVTSFDPVAIELVRRIAPDLSCAFISRPTDPEAVETALRLGCTQLNLHLYRETSADLVRSAHDAGLRVGGGPCDTIEDLECAIAWSMDSVTSDNPSLLLKHLATA